ncbi:MAG: hypothetical protein QNK37_26480 [Acidobacteriota bacterium]|nr:hypothetical protein [Acidobacteriota bacterium]
MNKLPFEIQVILFPAVQFLNNCLLGLFLNKSAAVVLLSVLAPSFPAPAQMEDLRIHGFLSQGYLESSEFDFWAETQGGTFEFSEVGLNINKRLSDNLRLGLQLFARDLGDIGNHEVILDWALAEYQWRNELGFRIGKIKQPIGFYSLESDIDLLRDQIFLPQSLYAEGTRSLINAYQGVSVFGNLPGNIDFDIYVGNLEFDVNEPGTLAILQRITGALPYASISMRSDSMKGGTLRWNTPLRGLSFEVAYLSTDIIADLILLDGTRIEGRIDNAKLITTSAVYERPGWTVIAETSEYAEPDRPLGRYIQCSIDLTRRLSLHAGYDEFYPMKNDKNGDFIAMSGFPRHLAWQKDLSIGLRYDLGSSWVLKAEWHDVDGTGLIATFEPENLENITVADWHYLGLKATYNF